MSDFDTISEVSSSLEQSLDDGSSESVSASESTGSAEIVHISPDASLSNVS